MGRHINGVYYTDAEIDAAVTRSRRGSSSDTDKLIVSAVIGAVTGSTVIGGLLGGSLLGGLVGDILEGNDDSLF